jgi:hypothetical protein
MWELLAKLEGEMTKDAAEGARGVSVIFLNIQGKRHLSPEMFREAERQKVLEARTPYPNDNSQ